MNKTIGALRLLSSIDRQLLEHEGSRELAVKSLEERRASVRREISRFLLSSYDALLRARRYPPVVELRGAHCSGCHLRLTPRLVYQIRRGEGLLACPHCHRLLFDDARRKGCPAISGQQSSARNGTPSPAASAGGFPD